MVAVEPTIKANWQRPNLDVEQVQVDQSECARMCSWVNPG